MHYYLRSLGRSARKEPSDLAALLPELSRELATPVQLGLLDAGQAFSSVLRLASPGHALWTHFDVYPNLLVRAP